MAEIGSAYLTILPTTKNFSGQLGKQLSGDLDSAGKAGGKKYGSGIVSSAKGFVGPLAAVFAAGAAVQFFKGAIDGASDLAESGSKVSVVFGAQSAQILAASENSAKAMGISKGAYLAANGTLGNLLVSLKVAPKAAADMSQQMVTLAGDMASFNNVPVADALAAIQSGLTGETEPLKRFGVNMNDATLKAEALKLGLIASTKDAMDPQTKALAAQSLIMAQTGTAQGDFARTSDGLANQTKIATARLEDMQTTLGAKLVPVMSTAVDVGLKVMDWMQKNQPVAIAVASAIGALTVATWAMNSALFANPIGLVVVALVALGVGLVAAYQKSETFRNIVDGAFKAIAAAGRWLWNDVLAPVVRFLLNGFASVTEGIAKMLAILSNIPGFGWAKTAADKMEGAADKARDLAQGIRDIPDTKTVTINWVENGRAVGGSTGPSARATGGPVMAGQPYIVGELRPELFIPNVSGRIVPRVPTSQATGGATSSDIKALGDRISAELDRQARTIQTMQRQMA